PRWRVGSIPICAKAASPCRASFINGQGGSSFLRPDIVTTSRESAGVRHARRVPAKDPHDDNDDQEQRSSTSARGRPPLVDRPLSFISLPGLVLAPGPVWSWSFFASISPAGACAYNPFKFSFALIDD